MCVKKKQLWDLLKLILDRFDVTWHILKVFHIWKRTKKQLFSYLLSIIALEHCKQVLVQNYLAAPPSFTFVTQTVDVSHIMLLHSSSPLPSIFFNETCVLVWSDLDALIRSLELKWNKNKNLTWRFFHFPSAGRLVIRSNFTVFSWGLLIFVTAS